MKTAIKTLAIALCVLAPLTAFAIELRAAKAQGLVGERADGYLGAVKSGASAEVRALVADINAKRQAQYERIAEKNGIPVQSVEARAGQRAIEKTASGDWVFTDSWRRK